MMKGNSWRQLFILLGKYLKYFVFIFLGYAIFRTLLFSFATEFQIYFYMLDLVVIWILLISIILRFQEMEGIDGDFADLAFGSSLRLAGLFISTSVLYLLLSNLYLRLLIPVTGLTHEKGIFLGSLVINSLVGLLTILSAFAVIHRHIGPVKAFGRTIKRMVKRPGSFLILMLVFSSVSWLGSNLFADSSFLNYAVHKINFKSAPYGVAYFVTFLSLSFYGAYYWTFLNDGERG